MLFKSLHFFVLFFCFFQMLPSTFKTAVAIKLLTMAMSNISWKVSFRNLVLEFRRTRRERRRRRVLEFQNAVRIFFSLCEAYRKLWFSFALWKHLWPFPVFVIIILFSRRKKPDWVDENTSELIVTSFLNILYRRFAKRCIDKMKQQCWGCLFIKKQGAFYQSGQCCSFLNSFQLLDLIVP